MRRGEIEARVDALARELEGEEFAAAVKRLSSELDDAGREVLGELLIERAREQGAEEYREMTQQMREERWRVFMPRIRRRRAR